MGLAEAKAGGCSRVRVQAEGKRAEFVVLAPTAFASARNVGRRPRTQRESHALRYCVPTAEAQWRDSSGSFVFVAS